MWLYNAFESEVKNNIMNSRRLNENILKKKLMSFPSQDDIFFLLSRNEELKSLNFCCTIISFLSKDNFSIEH